jgi:hypothetical protein
MEVKGTNNYAFNKKLRVFSSNNNSKTHFKAFRNFNNKNLFAAKP